MLLEPHARECLMGGRATVRYLQALSNVKMVVYVIAGAACAEGAL